MENESNLGPFYLNVIEFENHSILRLPRSEHFQSEKRVLSVAGRNSALDCAVMDPNWLLHMYV